MPALLNTILMTALSLLIAVPLGVFAAIYLVEYAKRGSKLVRIIRMNAETLAGIPSIVYGLFGMLFFVTALKLGFSMLSGALTISIMILPVILRTSEEALMSVPDSYREGSFGLGAGRLRTVFRVVLPDAIPASSRASSSASVVRSARRRLCSLRGHLVRHRFRHHGLRANALRPYVRALAGGTLHQSNVCDRGGAFDHRRRYQRALRFPCKARQQTKDITV
jgi:ABC-type uncharacterized transport system permease subunit